MRARIVALLCLQVRPPLRGLLKVLQASHPGSTLLNMQKHLVRWGGHDLGCCVEEGGRGMFV